MAKLRDIDQKAEEKGTGLTTIWQFVKFTVVSMLAFVVQFSTLNILLVIPAIQRLTEQEFHWFVFSYDLDGRGLGMFIAFTASNVLAQIVAFFVNRKKTFGGTNSIPVTLTIFLVFTVALLTFASWLMSFLTAWLTTQGLETQLAGNIAAMAIAFIQFVAYFPVSKLLMRNKEKDAAKKAQREKNEEAPDAQA